MVSHLIVGDGAAGIAAATAIRSLDPQATITVFSADPNPYYFRAALTNYLIGQLRDDQLWGLPAGSYRRQRIGRFVERVVGVDPARSVVVTERGQRVPYDRLLIASGASPTLPNVPGITTPGVMTLRTLQDVRAILDLRSVVRQAIVVGAGSLGLELVQGLRHLGIDVAYLIRDPVLMPRALDATASDMVLQRLHADRVAVIRDDELVEIRGARRPGWPGAHPGSDVWVAEAVTRAGRRIPCDLICIAVGVRPNLGILQGSGIAAQQGVLADTHLRTMAPNVYAAGDVVQIHDPATGHSTPPIGQWQPARQMGQVAGANMVGTDRPRQYQPGAPHLATHLYGLDVAIVGQTVPRDAQQLDVLVDSADPAVYRRLILRDGQLAGALLVGDRRRALLYKRLIDLRADVRPIRSRLLDEHFDLDDWLARSGLGREEAAAREQPPAAVFATVFGLERVNRSSPSAGGGARIVIGDQTYPLDGTRTLTIGRDPAADIVLTDASVSRQHADILADGRAYAIRDRGSMNGTWVGVTRLQPGQSQALRDGDAIRVGTVSLTFEGGAEPGPQDAQPAASVPSGPPPHAPGEASLVGPSGAIAIRDEIISIGRGTENAVVVDSPQASWLHAQIVRAEDGYYLNDMGSRNGTLVNGARIVDAHPLRDGDWFEIGSVVFRFQERDASPGAGGPAGGQAAPWPAAGRPFERAGAPDPVQRAPRAELVVVQGDGAGTRFILDDGETILGRVGGDATIALNDPQISRRNAAISGANGVYTIRDLESLNGTIVNGRPLTQPHRLAGGDAIMLGSTTLRFQDRA